MRLSKGVLMGRWEQGPFLATTQGVPSASGKITQITRILRHTDLGREFL